MSSLRNPIVRQFSIDLTTVTPPGGKELSHGLIRCAAVKLLPASFGGTLSLRFGHNTNPIQAAQGDVIWFEDPRTHLPVEFDTISYDITSPVAGTALVLVSADIIRAVIGPQPSTPVVRASDGAMLVDPRGAAKALQTQVNVSVATQIVGANALRRAVKLFNNDGATTLYWGKDAGVVTASGFPLKPGTADVIETTQAIYGITTGAAIDVRAAEITD